MIVDSNKKSSYLYITVNEKGSVEVNFQELRGKVALVTGGAQGIGASLVKSLATLGVKVVVIDYNEEGIKPEFTQVVR